MVQLAEWQARFAELGVNVAGMTYDDQNVLAAFHSDNDLQYPLLQDIDVRHVDAYGIRNMSYEPGDSGYGIPEPGILYIDASGIVRLKFAVPGYRTRPPFEDLLSAIEALENSSSD